MNHRITTALTLTLSLAACGRPVFPYSARSQGDGGPGDAALAAPVLTSYSPGSLAVGQTLSLTGEGFSTKKGAQVLLRFTGQYEESKGQRRAVDYQVTARILTSTRLTWRLWPHIVFHPTGDRLGRFKGKVTATNYHKDSHTARVSNALAMTLIIEPSLIVRRSSPSSSSCAAVVSSTLQHRPWTFTVETVGLGAGTKAAPLTFYWGLRPEQWDLKLTYSGPNPPAIAAKGSIVLEDRATSGRRSSLLGGVKSYLLRAGTTLVSGVVLHGLATGAVPSSLPNLPVTVNVTALDASAKKVSLAVELTVRHPGEVSHGGEVEPLGRSAPVSMSGCIPGPREVVYSHSGSTTWERTLTVKHRQGCKPSSFPWPWPSCSLDTLETNNVLHAFGLSGWKVSPDSKHHQSGTIPAGYVGMFYQQALRFHRLGKLTLYDQCGRSVAGADLLLTDWAFTRELATGPVCPPPSKLPSARTF